MQESRTLSPEHRALIAELCNELALTSDEKAAAIATFEDNLRRAFEPIPDFDYSQAVGLEAHRQMAGEHFHSLEPTVVHGLLNAAVGGPERRKMRAALRQTIGRMFPRRS